MLVVTVPGSGSGSGMVTIRRRVVEPAAGKARDARAGVGRAWLSPPPPGAPLRRKYGLRLQLGAAPIQQR